MKDVRAVHVLQAAKHLVNEVLTVVVRQVLRAAYDLVQVCVHELVHEVDVVEEVPARRPQDVSHRDDVLVLEIPQQRDFAQCSSRVCDVLERVGYFFDGHLLSA